MNAATTTATAPSSSLQQQQLNVIRPTEAQLRWAQFHLCTPLRQHYQRERIRRLYQSPSPIPLVVGEECTTLHDDDDDDTISKGRHVLLRVSQGQYERRRERILRDGYESDRRNHAAEQKDENDDDEDVLDSIFAETKKRQQRRRRHSTLRWLSPEDDTERIRRFEAACHAVLATLEALEVKRGMTLDTLTTTATKPWTTPTPIDRTASWMIHIPPKHHSTHHPTHTHHHDDAATTPPQFTQNVRQHLQDVARHYLRDHHPDDNAKVADDDDEDVVSFVECWERHLGHTNNNGMIPPAVSHEEIVASFVAQFESVPRSTTTTMNRSPTVTDLIRQLEQHPQVKDGLVQRLVSAIETALRQEQLQQTASNGLICADGRLHRPTFARLIQRYLSSWSKDIHVTKQSLSSLPTKPNLYATVDITSEECNSVTLPPDDDDENDNRDCPHNPHVSKFVQTFVEQFEQQHLSHIVTTEDENDAAADHNQVSAQDEDDDNDGTFLTNRSVLEHLVYHCVEEASKMSRVDDEIPRRDREDTSSGLDPMERFTFPPQQKQHTIQYHGGNDNPATPVRSLASTTSDVFDRIRTVSDKMTSFRFGKEESIPNVPTNESKCDVDVTGSEHPKTSNNIVGTVSSKVSELFQSLHMKNTTDEAAYFAFREIQDQKRNSIGPPTNHDGDVSSQSSFRILPRGIRNVVKSFRKNIMTTPHRSQIENQPPEIGEHKLEMEGYDDYDDDENDNHMFNDVESGTDFSRNVNAEGGDHDDSIDQQQSALLFSGSMDTDGSTISGNGQLHSAQRIGLMAGIMLSPTLLTKRHQQAIRAVESYNWAQVKYLLSANPWLAEMADVNTNQYVLHKVAYYGSGQLGFDDVTGDVISVRNVPAPESLDLDLVNLFPSSVHKLDQDGNLPLHMAAFSANLPMIQLLGDKFSSGASVRNEDGLLPLHLVIIACASPLVVTINSDIEPVDVVQAVFKCFPGAIGVTDNEGNLPIHTAASVLSGSHGAAIISWLLNETEKQVLGPPFLRFRSKNISENAYDDALETISEVSQSESSVHGDESTNCLVVENELGYTPLLLAIYSHAGWEVIGSLLRNQTPLSLDSENNSALHLLVGEHYKDPAAALKVLSERPESAICRNDKGMLPIEIACLQMLPNEVILALVLVDLPLNLDAADASFPTAGFGSSWWYLVCECDDYYVNIVQDVVSLCTFPQIRSLCLMENGSGDILLTHATPKCRSVLNSVLRIVGRFEFVDSSPIFTDSLLGVDAFNALDFGSQLDPIPEGKSVILKCYTSEEIFLTDSAAIRGLNLNFSHCEEILMFKLDPMDSNRGPLPADGLERYFISVEKPKLTLADVVRGMLRNHACQTEKTVRRRYSSKVFLVLRAIANSLRILHSQGHVHGNLSLESCGKFEEWKLAHLMDIKRVGDTMLFSAETYAVPPEALQSSTNRGSDGQLRLRNDFAAKTSIDMWAFGKLAYEALVGKPLFPENKDTNDEIESLIVLRQWTVDNLVEVKRDMERVGIIEPGVEHLIQCLSPNEGARPSIEYLLQHTFGQC